MSSVDIEIVTGRSYLIAAYGDRNYCVYWEDLRTNLPRERLANGHRD
jgi:hypothetical protein